MLLYCFCSWKNYCDANICWPLSTYCIETFAIWSVVWKNTLWISEIALRWVLHHYNWCEQTQYGWEGAIISFSVVLNRCLYRKSAWRSGHAKRATRGRISGKSLLTLGHSFLVQSAAPEILLADAGMSRSHLFGRMPHTQLQQSEKSS